VKGFVKGSKKSKNGLFSDETCFSKKFSKESFGQIKHLSAVFMSNSILLNRMVLSESRFEARNMKIDFFLCDRDNSGSVSNGLAFPFFL